MRPLVWSAHLALGVPSMDEGHKAMLLAIEALGCAADETLDTGLLALIDLLERDFREEEQLMLCLLPPSRNWPGTSRPSIRSITRTEDEAACRPVRHRNEWVFKWPAGAHA